MPITHLFDLTVFGSILNIVFGAKESEHHETIHKHDDANDNHIETVLDSVCRPCNATMSTVCTIDDTSRSENSQEHFTHIKDKHDGTFDTPKHAVSRYIASLPFTVIDVQISEQCSKNY